jgi:DAACS family dicarboxylate/amino acid:cation (Na+ or H+) symporter
MVGRSFSKRPTNDCHSIGIQRTGHGRFEHWQIGRLGRIAGKTFAYYVATTLIACVLGLLLVNLFQPGHGVDLRLQDTVTGLDPSKVLFYRSDSSHCSRQYRKGHGYGQYAAVIFFAILFGFFINLSSDKTRVLLTDVFNGLYEVMIKITFLVIRFALLACLGGVRNRWRQAGDPKALGTMFGSLGIYAAIIAGGCVIQGLGILPPSCGFYP